MSPPRQKRFIRPFLSILLRCGLVLCSYAGFGQENQGQQPQQQLLPLPSANPEQNQAIVLRIPHAVIAKAVNQDFQHSSPVAREILGTRSQGVASCQGAVTCELVEHSTGAMMMCRIVGTVQSETCGTNGPAIIAARSNTTYDAQKFAFFDGRHFAASPATLQSSTVVTVTSIGSSMPGLRGKIVRRVASKRSQELHEQAQTITARLTADELRQRIDAEFDERIRTLDKKLQRNLSILEHFQVTGQKLAIRSSKECVEVGVLKKPVDDDGTSTQHRRPASDSIELWIQLDKGAVLKTLTIAELLHLKPTSFSDIFSRNARLSKLDKKLAIEFSEGWVMLQLSD